MNRTVTIEIINQGSLKLLQGMESLGLICMKPSASKDDNSTESRHTQPPDKKSYRSFRGYSKNSPNGSVDEFLARCRVDKERELAIEKRQEEGRPRHV